MILVSVAATGTLPVGHATYIEEITDGGEGVCKHCSRPIREVRVVKKRLLSFFGAPEEEIRTWVHSEDDRLACTGLTATPRDERDRS